MEICDLHHCTGCGMCSNLCPKNAITMKKGEHGFTYPYIDGDKCINCGLCRKKCPANAEKQTECTIKNVYAAWNVAKNTRKKSTSGGVCSLLENEILKDGGAVVGVKWDADFWGYIPSGFKMRNYNKGISLVCINSNKGSELFEKVKEHLNFETVTSQKALKTNKSFSEPFVLPDSELEEFWTDYGSGFSIDKLCQKYVKNPFKLPNLLFLRRLRKRYNWVIKR